MRELDDPYTAMAELARRPLVYWAMVLSLNSMYREELAIIGAVKRRWPHIEVWLTNTDGRAAAMAEAMRLGADGLLLPDGFHRSAISGVASAAADSAPLVRPGPPLKPAASAPPVSPAPNPQPNEYAETDSETGEPILSAEELRALLQDPPFLPSATLEEQE